MPYTPPTPSPGASPCSSRSSSFSYSSSNDPRTQSTKNLLNQSNPPRSATYLHRHRRSSSVSALPTMAPFAGSKDPRACDSIHQSPPPTDNGLTIPPNAVMSPPDSSQNSSDEEEGGMRRGRDLGRLQEQELKDALAKLPQRRVPSPEPAAPVDSTSTRTVDDEPIETIQLGRRRSGHTRSHSESVLKSIGMSGGSSRSDATSDIDDDAYRIPAQAPRMVRKKSGEVVKSSLKSPSRSRPISVPSTPTFPKNVHFDARIEHVRHFLHSEKPSAVSAGSSPVETAYDGESEYPFGADESDEEEWEIGLPNFPKDQEARRLLPVRLEKLCLSTDMKSLVGTVAVQNISFQKHVTARFTFDYWQTVSDVTAEFSNDVRRKDRDDGVDRFVFRIKLADQANLEKKTLFMCIRYRSGGQEHWDNNGSFNFQVDFKKKAKSATAPRIIGPRSNALPRSKSPTASTARPRTTQKQHDEFFGCPLVRTKEDSRSIQPTSDRDDDEEDTALPARRSNPSGNAFSGRYAIEAALAAAVKGNNGSQKSRTLSNDEKNASSSYFDFVPRPAKAALPVSQFSTTPKTTPPVEASRFDGIFNDNKPSIESSSYRELLDNYCFFGKASNKTLHKPQEKKVVQGGLPGHFGGMAEKPSAHPYGFGPSHSPPMTTLAQQPASGRSSPIPPNFAGYRHRRQGSGAFRFEQQKTPTVC
ncbi:hypothetical protein EX30DRAFT_355483 [Ascodesmis nigricans]|uniref:CBM21 domain-containing protein n=1 Tax=Ascodesmis nigricans TaxID=341454 RepID=A0A4V3SIG7_9PEZI|nr:hypothetical protein EX30DRAFT_355483 [Ascodesmis nigricans]